MLAFRNTTVLVKDAVKQCAEILVPMTKGKAADISETEAARAAAEAAEEAEAAANARNAVYVRMSDKLIELIGEAA